jgi:hypothetical protein
MRRIGAFEDNVHGQFRPKRKPANQHSVKELK